MTINLQFIRETEAARLYGKKNGTQQWIPRSVCPHTTKHPAKDGQPAVHEVEVEDWWLEKNPWPTPAASQKELFGKAGV